MDLQSIEEKDEAGAAVATYVSSGNGRIDVVVSSPSFSSIPLHSYMLVE